MKLVKKVVAMTLLAAILATITGCFPPPGPGHRSLPSGPVGGPGGGPRGPGHP